MRRSLVWIALSLGCGGTLTADAGTDATIDDAAAFPDAAFNFGDAGPSTYDAALVDVNVPLLDGGGPFICDKDVCDGRTQYCDNSSIGPDLGPARCVALPDGCVPANCACLPNANAGVGCSCERATTGDGLVAGCSMP